LFVDETPQSMAHTFAHNFASCFNVAKVFAPDMLNHNFGRMIFVSSVFAQKGASCESVYASSKAAVESLAKSLAKEFAPHTITVNTIAPGFIDTDMNTYLTQDERRAFVAQTALGRAGTAEEVAQAMLFLASNTASYITGQTLNINGGMF